MPSTVTSHFTYNAAIKALRITFVSGIVYEYENVPEFVYTNMKETGAKCFFSIKGLKTNTGLRKLLFDNSTIGKQTKSATRRFRYISAYFNLNVKPPPRPNWYMVEYVETPAPAPPVPK
ncbi:KTSC domain-containing protein [Pinibacter soli]|uniref:KTSC domain-containing protein n=1 Tax=Pinibacter soli TaxID=3044211 RepID=UPI003CE4E6CA